MSDSSYNPHSLRLTQQFLPVVLMGLHVTDWTVPAAVSTACPLWTESVALGCSLQPSGLCPVQKSKTLTEHVSFNQCVTFPQREDKPEWEETNSQPESEPRPAESAPPSLDPCCKTTHHSFITTCREAQTLYGKGGQQLWKITTWQKWPTCSFSAHFKPTITEHLTATSSTERHC